MRREWKAGHEVRARRAGRFLFLVLSFAASPRTVEAQSEIVVQGRVEDAITTAALPAIWVLSGDSASAGITDANGNFELRFAGDGNVVILAEGVGYLSQRFEIPGDIGGRRVVLRLEPDPLEVQGITVVAESAIEVLQRNLDSRRNGFAFGAVRAYNRDALNRFPIPGGTVMDLIGRTNPRLRACVEGYGLCVTGRDRTLDNPFPQDPVMLCLDERDTTVDELASLSLEAVSLVEFIGRNRVNAYTTLWYLSRAETDRLGVVPLTFGC